MFWIFFGSLLFVILSQIPVFFHLKKKEAIFRPLLIKALPQDDLALGDILKYAADGKPLSTTSP